MDDAHVLPARWRDWYNRFQEIERQQKAKSLLVVRAVIDPDTFPAWCRARGLNVDANARMAFANETARDTVKRMN